METGASPGIPAAIRPATWKATLSVGNGALDRPGRPHALATLGDVHLDAGEPSEAAARFTAALDLRKTLDDEPGQGWLLIRLATAQSALGSAEGVAYYLADAEEIASRTGDPELARECVALREQSTAMNRGE